MVNKIVLEGLNKDFSKNIIELVQNCLKKDVVLCLWETIRDPVKQGAYWGQSRSLFEIKQKIEELRDQGAHFLADCIPPGSDNINAEITDAIPGYSWHQWGEAVDMVWVVNNKVCWDTELIVNGINGYQVYAEEAVRLGLESGFYWDIIKDACHIQMRKESSPSFLYSLKEIDQIMLNRFHRLLK